MTRRDCYFIAIVAVIAGLGSLCVGVARADTPPTHGIGSAVVSVRHAARPAARPAARTPLHPVGFHTASGIYCEFGMTPPTSDLPLGEGSVTCIYAHAPLRAGCQAVRYRIAAGSLTGRRVYVPDACPQSPPRFSRAVVDHTLRPGETARSSDDAVSCTVTAAVDGAGHGLTCADANEGGGFNLLPSGRHLYATGWLD